MAVSTNEPNSPVRDHVSHIRSRLSRYDLVLAAMPVLFVLAVLVAALLAAPLRLGIAVGAVGSIVLVTDVLYINPPSDVPVDR